MVGVTANRSPAAPTEDIHLEEPDPAHYDRLCGDSDDQEPPP
jgi:hypothetical protein